MSRGVAESLRRVRLQLEEINRVLLNPTPENLDDCEQRLSQAVEKVEAGRPFWKEAAGDRETAIEARSVRRALKHTKRLLDNAARFYGGWHRIRAAADGQYRSDGSLPELRCAARILIRG